MTRLRIAAGIALGLIGCAVLGTIFCSEPEIAPARAFTSSQQCADCHTQVYAEWKGSWHARSWNDPDVRALSNDFANADCIDCHAPRPVFETGLASRVLPRSSRREEGVDCIACHMLPEGAPGLVAGTIDSRSAPCRPTTKRELRSPDFCAPCHDQHKTVQQWRASRYARENVGCIDCHMTARDGGTGRGRDHTMHGGHDLELVKRAVTLGAKRDGARVLVAITNVGAGHHFPTDERARAGDVFWRPLAGEGRAPGPWRFLYRFRSPYRDETGVEDTLLPADATKELVLEDPEASGAIEVALFYKLTPYWKDPARPDPDSESRLVHRAVVAP